MKRSPVSINPRDALILQQISLHGEDDVEGLSVELGESRQRIINRLHALRTSGLVILRSNYEDIWVELTNKGKRLVNNIWPEIGRAWV